MDKLYIYRILNMKNLEIFQVKDSRFGDFIGYLGFVDYNKPATLDDFPYLKGIEDENEFGSENFIKALFISNVSANGTLQEDLQEITDCFIGNKEDCYWNIDFLEQVTPLENLEPTSVAQLVCTIIKERYHVDLDIPSISPQSFNHLTQF